MFERGERRLPRSRTAHAWVLRVDANGVWASCGPPRPSELKQFCTSHFLSFYFKRKRKSQNTEPNSPLNTVPSTAPCCRRPGLWPPEQCHPLENGGQVGGWTWLRVHDFSPTPVLSSASSWRGGMLLERWDTVGPLRSHPANHQLFQTVQSVSQKEGGGDGSIWGAAVGRAGCGGHGHARGAWGGHGLADVGHEEGVAGQLVHIDAVLLTVD